MMIIGDNNSIEYTEVGTTRTCQWLEGDFCCYRDIGLSFDDDQVTRHSICRDGALNKEKRGLI